MMFNKCQSVNTLILAEVNSTLIKNNASLFADVVRFSDINLPFYSPCDRLVLSDDNKICEDREIRKTKYFNVCSI